MKLVNIAKNFAKPIGLFAVGVAAIGCGISSVLNRNDEDNYDDYEDDAPIEDYDDEPEETTEEPVDDAE